MAATSVLLLATAITLAIALIVAILLVARARLDAYVRAAPLIHIRSTLALEIVSSASLLLAALAIARQLGSANTRTLTPSNALWSLVGLPACVAAICLGLGPLRSPGPARADAPPPHASLWRVSALVAGAVTVLLILSGRLVLADALLILVAVPAWTWMVSEWRPGSRNAGVPPPRPSQTSSPSPGPRILLLCLALAALHLFVAARAPFPPIADVLTAAALLALLMPFARAARAPGLDPECAAWTTAPVFLAATVSPLVALAAATVTHVVVVVNHVSSEAAGTGATWIGGVAESLASMPYLSGLPRLITPALLALALPLLAIALAGVSPRIQRLAGLVLVLSGIVLGASIFVSI